MFTQHSDCGEGCRCLLLLCISQCGLGRVTSNPGLGLETCLWTEHLRYVHSQALGSERPTRFLNPCNCMTSWDAVFIKALELPHCKSNIAHVAQTSSVYLLWFKMTVGLLGTWESLGSCTETEAAGACTQFSSTLPTSDLCLGLLSASLQSHLTLMTFLPTHLLDLFSRPPTMKKPPLSSCSHRQHWRAIEGWLWQRWCDLVLQKSHMPAAITAFDSRFLLNW